jgi:hypothetical protein
MKRMETVNGSALRPFKVRSREVPHAVIESNYTCNRRCVLCYNQSRDIVKPLEQIRSEVDLALKKRNLETISILGGEPTLHPDLPAIVRYVKTRGVYCQVLTNGIVLFRDVRNGLLNRLAEAGIDRIVLHVDCGQGIAEEEMDFMCATLFRKFEERGIFFALSSTLYRENCHGIPPLMRRYASYRYFDGILATLARPNEEMIGPVPPEFGRPEMREVDESIRSGLGVRPSSYIPSSLDDDEIRWLMYLYYINARTGVTVPISPRLVRVMRRAYRLVEGRNMFAATTRLSRVTIVFLATSFLECLFSPSRIPEFLRCVRRSGVLGTIRFHSIVLQAVPNFNAQQACVEICYHCPDATIRNGRLAPVCLADSMSLPGRTYGDEHPETVLASTIYAHLEEP